MSDRNFKEKTENIQSDFNEFSKIQESQMEPSGDKIIHKDELALLSNEKLHQLSSQITENQLTSSEMANRLNSIFGDEVKGTFELYRRAGKFFFRCDHSEGEKYSQVVNNLLKIIIEQNMGKTNAHYITTPNSVSVIFR